MNSNTFVIGDIHGGFRALQQVIDRAKISEQDKLIFLGDYVDGWSESAEVIDFLIALSHKQHCIFIRGNHDQLFLDWLESKNDNIDEGMWFKHGGEATVKAYEKVSQETKNRHIVFLKSLQDYYLDNQNRLFIHAGFTNMNGVTYEYFPKLFYWDRTLWETALSLDNSIEKTNRFYPDRLKIYPEVYIGHTPTTRIGQSVPVNKACIWNIDTGAAFKGKLTILNIETKAFWQSDNLPDLYPDENGRN
jgi:serine/threonine protein phosphatase 1